MAGSSSDPLKLILAIGAAFGGYQILVNGNKQGTIGYEILHGGIKAATTSVGGGGTGGSGTTPAGTTPPANPDTSCSGWTRPLTVPELATTGKPTGTTIRDLFMSTTGLSEAGAMASWKAQGGSC